MRDPFPFPPPEWLVDATRGFADAVALPVLSLHVHEVILVALGYHAVCTCVSPLVSRALFPGTYAKLNERTRLNWDVHFVSMIQSCFINAIGLWQITYNAERKAMDWRDRVWGYDGGLGFLVALACGYFLWDLAICAYHLKTFGPGLLAHAASALSVYLFGFRPVVNWYAPVFILFELSTPFLNMHWYFDKLNMTGSDAQLYNGVLLMASFFGSRLVWGTYNCFRVFPDLLKALEYQDTAEGAAWLASGQAHVAVDAAASALHGDTHAARLAMYTRPRYIPTWVAGVYLGSYLTLMLLNVFWFGKMIETIRARFDPPFGTRTVKPETKVEVGRGVDADGGKSVEVGATEVRQRRSRKA